MLRVILRRKGLKVGCCGIQMEGIVAAAANISQMQTANRATVRHADCIQNERSPLGTGAGTERTAPMRAGLGFMMKYRAHGFC
ncbi:hypothetical protein ACQ4M4_03610 [Leptolyngbya sp. AN02str]|uniref:hypothetical protein n=1 Tax=Leptolyngbya sp. AN02str TaxID=3423363 RepID=UPI003D323341